MPSIVSLSLRTSFTGWLTAFLIALQIVWPYLMRSGTRLASPSSSSFSAMRPHFWLGYALPGLAFVHAWIPMASGHMPRTSMTGLWLATYALGLILLQALLGIATRVTKGLARNVLRRVHFAVMFGIAALIAAHLYLN
jgi:hypothetical protein